MKKRKAIRKLRVQINRLLEEKNTTNDLNLWVSVTAALLKVVFCKTGEEKINEISKITYRTIGCFSAREEYFDNKLVSVGQVEAYMNSYIQELELAGVEKNQDDNRIIQLMKNPYFWVVLVPLATGSYFLGNQFGLSRLDSEKAVLYESIRIQDKAILERDSVIQYQDKMLKDKR